MKTEKLITGIILTFLGLLLLIKGYQDMQPDIVEKGFDILSEISRSMGEEMPMEYTRDKTTAYLMFTGGVVLVVFGLGVIYKGGKQND